MGRNLRTIKQYVPAFAIIFFIFVFCAFVKRKTLSEQNEEMNDDIPFVITLCEGKKYWVNKKKPALK